jgi:hypothetical protein
VTAADDADADSPADATDDTPSADATDTPSADATDDTPSLDDATAGTASRDPVDPGAEQSPANGGRPRASGAPSVDRADSGTEAESTPGTGAESGSESGPDPELNSEPVAPTEDGRRASLDPERYLFAGETVEERVGLGRGWVVATTHRLLVFDPASEGRRFVSVDRPNVVAVRRTGGGSRRLRSYALRAGIYAVVLWGGWLGARSLGLRSLFGASPDVSGTPGVGGLVSALSLVQALLDAGVVAGLAALALGALYLRGRDPTLVVERAGHDDLRIALPSASVGRRAVAGLERAFADELALSTPEE